MLIVLFIIFLLMIIIGGVLKFIGDAEDIMTLFFTGLGGIVFRLYSRIYSCHWNYMLCLWNSRFKSGRL